MRFFILVIIFGFNSCLGYFYKVSPNEKMDYFIFSGNKRTYLVHYPKKWDGLPIPMLVALHGRFGTGVTMSKQTKLNDLSDQKGFIVLYPDGYKRSWADGRGNSPADEDGINDVVFIESIVKRMIAEGSVNAKEVYLVGHSNGGFMAQRMAIEKPELWKGVMSVAAQISVAQLKSKLNFKTKPVSVAIMAGTEDPLVPYGGGYVKNGKEVISVSDSIQRWKEWNGCQDNTRNQSKQYDENGFKIVIEFYRYEDCLENTKVELIQMNGLGHSWPGETPMLPFINQGRTTNVVDGSAMVWEFMESLK
ncbi:putative esterase [Leptospira yanagawae serovar Saopaulo str. Sao Paulo = ATCC 700523]|uniref:Putative esterase n=1 Tax=Leptospira yanagawae serovar Saopaulo str. Sao Paulo = ATCC 700523 TaxID=1249483 RepID=A0A5E8HDN9_9LEPT|nr:PHB depolymerase family esterase [Leptospira yanagawae]EOQ89385.1 putative esterase [Leptospira yanagawae serovar Saopaulo str. Sao Paulo = ATCC 700523]